jgi:K+ transporter
MAPWREKLFVAMQRNANERHELLQPAVELVIELGSQSSVLCAGHRL